MALVALLSFDLDLGFVLAAAEISDSESRKAEEVVGETKPDAKEVIDALRVVLVAFDRREVDEDDDIVVVFVVAVVVDAVAFLDRLEGLTTVPPMAVAVIPACVEP